MLGWTTLALGSAAVAYCYWQLPSSDVGLRVSGAPSDQVRITWNRESAPVLLAKAAVIEILDGGTYREALLTGEQLQSGSMTYRRESGTVEVRLRLESRWRGRRPALAWFRGGDPRPDLSPAVELQALLATTSTAGADVRPEVESVDEPGAPPPRRVPAAGGADRSEPPTRREAVIPDSVPAAAETPTITIPPPLLEPIAKPVAIGSLPISAPAPRPPAYSGPHAGRIIWTGSMGRRGVVEIEGARASIGSLSGGLPGVAVAVRVSPADFSSRGLVVHSAEALMNQRYEDASAANGWNATFFQWEPDLARELVVLEAPNPSNEFKRLVVRNDARRCSVIVVDWTLR